MFNHVHAGIGIDPRGGGGGRSTRKYRVNTNIGVCLLCASAYAVLWYNGGIAILAPVILKWYPYYQPRTCPRLSSALRALSSFYRPFSRWTCVSRCLLKQRMMEVVVTTGAINRAKLQSNHHPPQINTEFFTGRMPFLSPNQQCQSTEWKISHSMDLLTQSSHGGSSNFVSDH